MIIPDKRGRFLDGRPLCLLLASAIMLLLGQSCYIIKQGNALFEHRSRALPVAELLLQPDLPTETRTFLVLVEDIRRFGTEVIGLAPTENYTTYIAWDKDYLLKVVNASEELSFKKHTWWFPFFGSAPYLGFFDDNDADLEASQLHEKGFDVHVRKVNAFSTLGILKDPLYSFMIKYSPYALANLILHEQTHASLWIGGDFNFNERLATFIGDKGALLYLQDRGLGDAEYAHRLELYSTDLKRFYSEIYSLRLQLETLYIQNLPIDEARLKKKSIIETWKANWVVEYNNRFKTQSFRHIINVEINNAWIDLWHTYTDDIAQFETAFQKSGGTIKAFLADLKTAGVHTRPPLDVIKDLAAR